MSESYMLSDKKFIVAERNGKIYYKPLILNYKDITQITHIEESITRNTLNTIAFLDGVYVIGGESICLVSVDNEPFFNKPFYSSLNSKYYKSITSIDAYNNSFSSSVVTTFNSSTMERGTYLYSTGLSNAKSTSIDWVNGANNGGTINSILYGCARNIGCGTNGSLFYNVTIRKIADSSIILKDISYNDDTFIVVGTKGTIATGTVSPVGGWKLQTSNTTETLNGVCYGDGIFVIVGSNGTILTSNDGIEWSSQTSGITNSLKSIAYGGGLYVAVGVDGTIIKSYDIVNWELVDSGTTETLNDICYGYNEFIIVGDKGTILKAE